jgi:phosphate-selective porin
MKRSLILLLAIVVMVSFVTKIVSAEVKVKGFTQIQIVNDASKVGRELYFTVKRARAIVKGAVTEKVGVFSQLEMFTDERNILDVVIDYDLGTCGKIAVGRFTKPFGLQNPVSPYNLHTINYGQVVANLIGSGGRDFGLRLMGKTESISWALAYINGADGGTTVAETADDNDIKDIVGRVGFSPTEGMGIGVSMYSGKAGVLRTAVNRQGFDVKYEKDSIYAQLEYIMGLDFTTDKSGYYLEAGYRVGDLQPIIRYDFYDDDTSSADDEKTITALGLNYYIEDSAKIQLICETKTEIPEVVNNVVIVQTAVKF